MAAISLTGEFGPKTSVTAASPDDAEEVTLTQSEIRVDPVTTVNSTDRAGLIERANEAIVDQALKRNIEDAPVVCSHDGYAPLHARTADLILTLATKQLEDTLSDDLRGEVLFRERISFAAAKHTVWARRRKLNITDLAHAPLISPPPDTPGGAAVIAAFRRHRSR